MIASCGISSGVPRGLSQGGKT